MRFNVIMIMIMTYEKREEREKNEKL